jgi:esterase/lipase
MASGVAVVGVSVGGTIAVSVGTGVDVPAASPLPQAVRLSIAANPTKRIMNL